MTIPHRRAMAIREAVRRWRRAGCPRDRLPEFLAIVANIPLRTARVWLRAAGR